MKSKAVKEALFFAVFALIFFFTVIILFYVFGSQKAEATRPAIANDLPTAIIDAGHGGKDGGAVGADGTLEKDLNLEISNILCELMRVSGYNVVMTRTSDSMLTTDDGRGSEKTRDLKQRLTIASRYPDALMISIHCNKFPSEKCKGLQVYHSKGELAEKTAKSIQDSVTSILQPSNNRKVKQADSSIYLLDRAVTPSVLIECGFLSNSEECALLNDNAYRKKLVLSILCGISAEYGETA